jgi:hypothetical protein
MKKLMFAGIALIASVMVSYGQEAAQDSSSNKATSAVTSSQQGDKVKIKTDELPEAAKQALEDTKYKGWLINAAYRLKNDKYEVELKNGADTKVVHFNKEGQTTED